MAVSRRKRVGLPKCAHGHPLCCPFCNSRDFTKPPEERIGVHKFFKADLSSTNSARESPNGISLRSRQTNAIQIRVGYNFRRGTHMSKAIGRAQWLPARAQHSAG